MILIPLLICAQFKMANRHWLKCSLCHCKLSLNEYITCKQCNQKFHYDCVDLPEHIRPMVKEVQNYFTWFCKACKKPSTPSPNQQPNFHPVMFPANIYRPVMLPASASVVPKNVVQRSKSFAQPEVRESGIYISTVSLNGNEVHLPINDYFVELEMEEKRNLRFRNTRQKIELNEIFHRSKNCEGFRNSCVLITAEAGFGKTTLVKKLNHDWATLDRPNYISHFDIVVNASLRQTQNQPVEETIMNDIFCKHVPNRRLRHSMSRKSQILIILDGLDEIDEKDNAIEFLKDHKRILENVTETYFVIVTSRPHGVVKILHLFDRHISILGLSSLRTYALKMVLPKPKAENLLRNIAKDRFLSDISKCPLMFHILCFVYRNDSSLVATTRTELYLLILNLLIKIYEKNHGISYCSAPLTKRTIIEDKLFVRLGRIAWDFLRNLDSITEKELLEQFEDTELKFVLGLSILVPVPTVSNREVVTMYKFLYCSFIEFFASVYLLNEMKTPESRQCTKETLLTYKEMLKPGFVVGLLGEALFKHEILLQWLTRKSQTFSELNEIKNEAGFAEDSWKSFCKEVKKLKCSSHLEDNQILNFEIALPNLSQIRILFFQKDFVHQLINKFNTIYHLVINLSVRLASLSVNQENNVTLYFLDMMGIMSELISVEKILSSNRKNFVVSVILSKESQLGKMIKDEKQTTSGRIAAKALSRKKNKPVGLLATLLPLLKCTTDQRFLWKIGSIEIEYKIGEECKSLKEIPFPIIVITTEEYDVIGEEPFSHESGLKITGFGDFPKKIPKMFGHVRSSTFFECFNEHRSKALSLFLDNPEEEYVGKMINSLLITHPPEPARKHSIL